jgi:hypothetical protein
VRRHPHERDDGLFQAADELAGRTKQRPPDWLGVGGSRCPRRDVIHRHFVSHILEQRLWRSSLEITLGFMAPGFGSVGGTENESRRGK